MRRRPAVTAAVVMALAGVAGCTGDSPKDGASSSASSSTASTPTSSESPTESPTDEPTGPTAKPKPYPSFTAGQEAKLPTTRIEAASLHTAILGTSSAKTAGEKAVVDAWMTYWQGTADTLYLLKPTKKFNAVAREQARSFILDYVDQLKSNKERVVGWSLDNVQSVKVDGDTATMRDCTKNFTFTVDVEIEPVTRPVPFYDVNGTLKKAGGKWTVVEQSSKELEKSCL